mgnify:CR=1 FL=1
MKANAVIASIFLTITPAFGQTVFRSDEHHFSVDVPAGWERSEKVLNFTNEVMAERVPDAKYSYFAAFVPSASVDEHPPYILFQFSPIPMSGTTYEELEQEFGGADMQAVASEKSASIKDLVGELEFGRPVLDRANERFYLRLKAKGGAAGSFDAVCVGFLTSDGVVQLNSYAPEGSGADPAAQLQPFLDGFRLDPGARFVPAPSGQSVNKVVRKGVGGAFRGGIIGAGVGAVVGLLVYILRNQKKGGAWGS